MLKDTDFDLIECWEDMASKNGALISSATFREFLAPNYRRIAEFARKHGIQIVLVDSDGLIEELNGLMLEAGVSALYPYEVGAGNDPVRVRAHYPTVGMIGCLEKDVMARGRKAMDAELEKARRLIGLGRLIPGPDHFVLANVSFADYAYFMNGLREVVMSTRPGNAGSESLSDPNSAQMS